ncbi:MAG: hypothetical protein BWX80_00411 [Candidatus Hydrogenedentes bacterium ADurb.Bin101]|nr:MAG: hypothetical protein BWX80_00411 [Candidatus Hydrogenedentes bacterium ADurb.Bin101]
MQRVQPGKIVFRQAQRRCAEGVSLYGLGADTQKGQVNVFHRVRQGKTQQVHQHFKVRTAKVRVFQVQFLDHGACSTVNAEGASMNMA